MQGSASAPRILVGEDEDQLGRLILDVLQPIGYEIDITKDGTDALSLYRAGRYALLLLDTLLTKTSGLELVMKLRDGGDSVPIILISGPLREPDRVDSFAFTYRADVLRKPFGIGELRTAVERALHPSQSD